MSIKFKRRLPIPKEVKEMYPVSEAAAKVKKALDCQIADIFTGKSDKKLLIIGPCSADREDAVFEYCTRLRKVQDEVNDKLVIIPRVYTNKPRTTGDGYKGMLHQPDPNEKPNPFKGVLAIRALHTKILTELGMSTADEMLYPDVVRSCRRKKCRKSGASSRCQWHYSPCRHEKSDEWRFICYDECY